MVYDEKMAYDLGIDAGGTYTDSVLIRRSDGKIVCSNKALTTYPDPLEGIKNRSTGLTGKAETRDHGFGFNDSRHQYHSRKNRVSCGAYSYRGL